MTKRSRQIQRSKARLELLAKEAGLPVKKVSADAAFEPNHPDVTRGRHVPWDDICADVIELYLQGKQVPQIVCETGYRAETVRGIVSNAALRIKAERIKQEITEAVFKDKVPVLDEIAGCTLVAITEWIRDFTASGKHLNMGPKEAANLATLIKNVDEMYRLSTGKATANVAVAYSLAQTREALEDLKKIDPVFEYPDLGQN